MIRRFKRDVIKDMPIRKEVIVRVEPTKLQTKILKNLISENVALLSTEKKEATCKLLFTHMRQVCNHPGMLTPAYCTDTYLHSQHLKTTPVPQCTTPEQLIE